MTAPLTVLMLQGPPTAFWPELGAALRCAGHRVIKVHFTLADWLFWRGPGQSYRGRLKQWPDWLEALCKREGVTDILYYADRLPYHVSAAEIGARLGLRVWAIENGYLRPDWLTLEPFGMGQASRFPKQPERIREMAGDHQVPEPRPRFSHPFLREAFSEVLFNLSLVLGRPLYPRYVSDHYYPVVVDYLFWLPKFWRQTRHAARFAALEERCATGLRYSLLAMQLQSDYQIRASSPFNHLSEMLEEVVGSLAADASGDHHLVIKLHPLESGWENWPRQIARIAARHGVADRVHWIDGGDLARLVTHAAGVVTVNSTVGLHSLRAQRPTMALGTAIYDLPGLTHQGGLASFWNTPELVDPLLLNALLAALAGTIQVRGSFYDPEGRQAACDEIVRRFASPVDFWFQ